MEIPSQVLEALGFSKPRDVLKVQQGKINVSQVNEVEIVPVGCNPKRTTTAVSKVGRKDKGRFVKIFYRTSRLPQEPTIEVKREQFWRDLDELVERNQHRNRQRPHRSDDGRSARRS